ncbi:hypothetical protein GCM10009121_06630 [Rhodanobacter soli]
MATSQCGCTDPPFVPSLTTPLAPSLTTPLAPSLTTPLAPNLTTPLAPNLTTPLALSLSKGVRRGMSTHRALPLILRQAQDERKR